MPDLGDEANAKERLFRRAYECHYSKIYAYVIRRLHDQSPADAADLASEVFMTAWRKVDKLPPPPEDRLWLYGIARHKLAHFYRGESRKWRLSERLRFNRDCESPQRPPDDKLHEKVRFAIDQLSAKDQEVIRLVMWDELTNREASIVLGCSPNAVAIRLHRAKAHLRPLMSPSAELNLLESPLPRLVALMKGTTMTELDSLIRASDPVRTTAVPRADSVEALVALDSILRFVNGSARPRRSRISVQLVTATAVAIAAVFVASLMFTTSPAGADIVRFEVVDGYIVATIRDPEASAEALRQAFLHENLNIDVVVVPVSPSRVGTVTNSSGPGAETILPIRNQECLSPSSCREIGLRIPIDFEGEAHVQLGRAAMEGEGYRSGADAFMPGEVLHCSDIYNQKVESVSQQLSEMDLNVTWMLQGQRVPFSKVPPSGYITSAISESAEKVILNVDVDRARAPYIRDRIEGC